MLQARFYKSITNPSARKFSSIYPPTLITCNSKRYLKPRQFLARSFAINNHRRLQGPVERYKELIADGVIKEDESQFQAVQKLQNLFEELQGYDPLPLKPLQVAKPKFRNRWEQELAEERDHLLKFKKEGWILGKEHNARLDFDEVEDQQDQHITKVEKSVVAVAQDANLPVLKDSENAPRGIYLYGDVGTGKTLLMDLFFASLPHLRKKRVHFNTFMIDFHKRMNQWAVLNRTNKEAYDPIVTIAYQFAKEAHLYCFDEFQLTDIADARILSRVFSALFSHGAVLLTTSNRHPDELCNYGHLRESIEPFVEMMKNRTHIVRVGNETERIDYRRMQKKEEAENMTATYLKPLTSETEKTFLHIWDSFVIESREDIARNRSIELPMGRTLVVPDSVSGVAKYSFDTLCRQPLGAADYHTLANRFDTVMISAVPQMALKDKEAARRFITLIDELYNKNCRLICSADADPDELFTGNKSSVSFSQLQQQDCELTAQDLEVLDEAITSNPSTDFADEYPGGLRSQDEKQIPSSYKPKQLTTREQLFGTLLTGEEERFMFRRAASRLHEMQSAKYLRKWALNVAKISK